MGLFSSEPPSHFPVVKGRRLDGTDVRFPDDLPADATLLIVSFRDELDPLSDQWARLGDRIAERHGGRFETVEVPVVNSKLKLLGGLATVGIRGQVETDAEHARTVPIYADIKAFRKTLQVSTSDVYPILVARDGRIAWRGDGDIDMDEVAELEAAVDETLRQPVPPFTDHPDVDAPEAPEGDPEAAAEPNKAEDAGAEPLADAAGERPGPDDERPQPEAAEETDRRGEGAGREDVGGPLPDPPPRRQ